MKCWPRRGACFQFRSPRPLKGARKAEIGREQTGSDAMYQHILIATDGSDLAQKAVEMGLSLAKAHRARVTAITASEPWSIARSCDGTAAVPFDAYERAAASEAAKILASVGRLAIQLDVEWVTAHVKEHAADGILQAARSRGCDLIVMASNGRRGLSRLMLGSQAVRVLTHSAVPVLICK
jgi:nucleotide-binding universal stress UspA family protein